MYFYPLPRQWFVSPVRWTEKGPESLVAHTKHGVQVTGAKIVQQIESRVDWQLVGLADAGRVGTSVGQVGYVHSGLNS
jgi:hypothetical protein